MRTDPIIAKIARQRELYQLFEAAGEAEESVCYAACDAYNAGFKRLVRSKPRTRAGAAALVEHCLGDVCFLDRHAEALTLLQTLGAVLPTLA